MRVIGTIDNVFEWVVLSLFNAGRFSNLLPIQNVPMFTMEPHALNFTYKSAILRH